MVKRPVVLDSFYLFHSYKFLLPFSRLFLRWTVDIVREPGRQSKSSVKAVAIFLFLVVKPTLSTVPCNENVPRLFLQQLRCFRPNPNPGPVSASTADKINCLVMNARSLKTYHKDSRTNWQSVYNLCRFQDLVYAENFDVICVNETWLNQNISNSEILRSGFRMFSRDRSD